MKLENVRLLVNRFDECFRFYTAIMGFKATWGQEGHDYASFKVDGKVSLALFKRHLMAEDIGTRKLPEEAVSQDRLALVFNTKNLDVTVKELGGRGAHFINTARDHPEWGIRSAYLRDPDGNLIEINSPLSKNKWTIELRNEDSKFENG